MNKQTGIIRVSMTTMALTAVGAICLLGGTAEGIPALEGWWQGAASSQMAFGVLGQSLPAVWMALGFVMLTALWRAHHR